MSFFDDEDSEPSQEDLQAWRTWVTTIFAPHNRRLYDLITSKADLLVEEQMPSDMLQLCAHALAWEVVLGQWANDDFSRHVPLVEYPGEINTYARRCFVALKTEQAKLLGRI